MTFAEILKRTLVGICILSGLALAAYVGLQVIGGPMGGLVGAVVYFAAWGIYRLWYLRRKDEADISKKKIVMIHVAPYSIDSAKEFYQTLVNSDLVGVEQVRFTFQQQEDIDHLRRLMPEVYVYFQPREDDEEEGGAGTLHADYSTAPNRTTG